MLCARPNCRRIGFFYWFDKIVVYALRRRSDFSIIVANLRFDDKNPAVLRVNNRRVKFVVVVAAADRRQAANRHEAAAAAVAAAIAATSALLRGRRPHDDADERPRHGEQKAREKRALVCSLILVVVPRRQTEAAVGVYRRQRAIDNPKIGARRKVANLQKCRQAAPICRRLPAARRGRCDQMDRADIKSSRRKVARRRCRSLSC